MGLGPTNEQVVFLQGGDPLTENRPADSYSVGQLGQTFSMVDAATGYMKRYQLVQADSTLDVTPAQGTVMWWRNATGYLVTTNATIAGRGDVAGVVGGLVTADYICCVQQGGPAPVQFQSGTPTDAGLFAVPSATSGKADAIAAGSPATYPPLGRTASAATAGVATVQLEIQPRP